MSKHYESKIRDCSKTKPQIVKVMAHLLFFSLKNNISAEGLLSGVSL